jgi:hypothetical protein
MRTIKFTIIGENGKEQQIEEVWEDSEPIPIPVVKEKKEVQVKPVPVSYKEEVKKEEKAEKKKQVKVSNTVYKLNKDIIPKDVATFSKGFQFPFFK